MKQNVELLLNDLEKITVRLIDEVEQFKMIELSRLNEKRSEESWSALECLDHLNQYGDYYIPEMTSAVKKSIRSKPKTEFKSGWLGIYFANMMLPKEGMKRIKSPKDKLPAQSGLSLETIDKFLKQQNQLLELLKVARNQNLEKLKCSISLSKLVKLKLGDTLRFVIYHNWRHIEQAKAAL